MQIKEKDDMRNYTYTDLEPNSTSTLFQEQQKIVLQPSMARKNLSLSALKNIDVETQTFDCRKEIANIIEAMLPHAKQRRNRMLFEYGDEVPRRVISRPNILRKILLNLVEHAINCTFSGDIMVSVGVIDLAADCATLHISIEDTGIGISEDNMRFIFDSAMIAAQSTIDCPNANAVDLAETKEWAMALGGSLGVNSKQRMGSIFWMSLPVQLPQAPMAADKIMLAIPDIDTARVLIIDDHIKRGTILQRHLNFKSSVLAKSSHALDDIIAAKEKGEPFSLVIIEDDLKSVRTLKLARDIKKIEASMGLFLLSEHQSVNELLQAQEAGFYKVFYKPMQAQELMHALSIAWKDYYEDTFFVDYIMKKSTPVKVLMVEDHKLAQITARGLLEQINCEVDMVEDAKTALERMDKHYDIIYLDIGLPDMDGVDLGKEIRHTELNKETPIIAVTAHGTEECSKKALHIGFREFITKPMSSARFTETLKHLNLTRNLE